MSDSPNFDASVTDPQAHGRIPGRLREDVTDLQAHGRIPGRLQGNVAGGPDSSSAGVALMEAATDANMRQHHGGGDR